MISALLKGFSEPEPGDVLELLSVMSLQFKIITEYEKLPIPISLTRQKKSQTY